MIHRAPKKPHKLATVGGQGHPHWPDDSEESGMIDDLWWLLPEHCKSVEHPKRVSCMENGLTGMTRSRETPSDAGASEGCRFHFKLTGYETSTSRQKDVEARIHQIG